MNVLIVDDQYTNRYLLEKLLTGYGYSVLSAADGIEALEILHRESIDLIIADILLPKMDGFQLCREVKSDQGLKKIPFIFYTAAYTEQKDREFAESLGADRFIVKPTDPIEFITIIRDLIHEIPEDVTELKTITLGEHEYLSEHNKRLIRQLEKKLAELEDLNKALRISEKRYKNLFEYANDAIILHEITPNDEFGRILEANSVASALLGYSHEELLSKHMMEIDTAKQFAHYQEFMATLLEKKHLTFEGEHIAKSGRIIPVELSAHLFEEDGRRLCLIICRDITFRKKAMEEMKRAIIQIDENLHQIATIGDQIRNPLSVIMSCCEECERKEQGAILDAINQIDICIQQLDLGSLKSEKVKNVLMKLNVMKSYGIDQDHP